MNTRRCFQSFSKTAKWLNSQRSQTPKNNISATIADWRRFWRDYWKYKDQNDSLPSPPSINLYPCLRDWTTQTQIEPIYYYQDWWAFKLITERKPQIHVDIGSHHKFVALLSCIVPVTFVDIRPPSLPLDGLTFKDGSLNKLPFADGSLESVSSLCVVEHIGLGRYGDPLNCHGTEEAIRELQRVLKPNGKLYLSVPVDRVNCVYFNAHRSFNEAYLFDVFNPLTVVDKLYIHRDKLVTANPGEWCVGCYALSKP
jgi:SAM-dependent methyltransferase